MRILEELYYGNIFPGAKYYRKDSPLAKLARMRESNKEKFLESLDENKKVLFKRVDDAQEEIDNIAGYEKFTYGFRLGVLLIAEAFTDMEETAGCHEWDHVEQHDQHPAKPSPAKILI